MVDKLAHEIIEADCPYCHATLRIPETYAGQKGTCNKCGESITVPELDRYDEEIVFEVIESQNAEEADWKVRAKNTLRWIALPPGAMAAGMVLYLTANFSASRAPIAEAFWPFIGEPVSNGFMAIGFVLGGSAIAPSHKSETAWALFGCAVCFSAILASVYLVQQRYFEILSSVAIAVGAFCAAKLFVKEYG